MEHFFKKTIVNFKQGIGLIEIVVGVGIISISLIGIVVAFALHFRAANVNTEKIQEQYLLEEGVEALRYLRNVSWNSNIAPLSTSTTYHLPFIGTTWEATTTATTTLETFTLTFVFSDVFRRTVDDDIVASTSPDTKYLDTNIKHVTMSVLNMTRNEETSVETYLANLFNN